MKENISLNKSPARVFKIATAIVVLLLLVSISVVSVFAWIIYSRTVVGYIPISAPESLYLGTGNGEDIRYLYFSGVDMSIENGHKDYVISVQGEGVTGYKLQLGYTTNNDLTYSLFYVDSILTEQPSEQVEAVKYTPQDTSLTDIYYVKGNSVHLTEAKNKTTDTYEDYGYIDDRADPLYWQTEGIEVDEADYDEFIHYYILRISWTSGINDRETDIICFAAQAGSWGND